MSKAIPQEKLTARINSADGNSMTFTSTGSVIGGMVELMSWLSPDRREIALTRLQAMHEQRSRIEAARAAEKAAEA